MNSEKGVTLVELLVASAVGGIIIMGTMSAMNFSQKTAKSISLTTDFTSLKLLVRQVINVESVCTEAFKRMTMAPSTLRLPLPTTATVGDLPTPLKFSDLVAGGQTILTVASTPADDGVTVTELSFDKVVAVLNPSRYIMNLHMVASKKVSGGQAVGGSLMTANFQMTVNVDNLGTITSCFDAFSAERNCNDMGGEWRETPSHTDAHRCLVPAVYQ